MKLLIALSLLASASVFASDYENDTLMCGFITSPDPSASEVCMDRLSIHSAPVQNQAASMEFDRASTGYGVSYAVGRASMRYSVSYQDGVLTLIARASEAEETHVTHRMDDGTLSVIYGVNGEGDIVTADKAVNLMVCRLGSTKIDLETQLMRGMSSGSTCP